MVDGNEVSRRRARVIEICSELPEAEVDQQGAPHAKCSVRKRTFAYYLQDHHGDGIVGLTCKVLPGEQQVLVAAEPERFTVPDYLGPKGWVNLRLDLEDIDWDEVRDMAVDSYRMVAPKRLAALV